MLEYIILIASFYFAKQCSKTAKRIFESVNTVLKMLQDLLDKLNESHKLKNKLFQEEATIYMLEHGRVFHFEHCKYVYGKEDKLRVFPCCKECMKYQE